MPYEDDYVSQIRPQEIAQLNLGSTQALQSNVPERTPEPPQEFMPQASRQKSFDFVPTPDHMLPSNFFGIVLKNAHLNMQMKEAHIAEGWANYHKTERMADAIMQEQERNAQASAWEYLPKARAYIDTFPLNTPQRKVAENYTRRIISGMHPDGLTALEAFIADPVAHYGANILLKDNVEAQQLFESMGPAFYNSDFAKRHGATLGHDMTRNLIGRFDKDMHDKLASGKMTQEEFLTNIEKVSNDPYAGEPVSPQHLQFIKAFMASPDGDNFLVGVGIEPNSAKLKRLLKEKPDDLKKQVENEQIQKTRDDLHREQEYPGTFSSSYVKQLKDDMRVFAGLQQKETNVGENPNNRVIQRWHDKTGHKYASVEEAVASPESPQRTAAIQAFHDSIAEQDKASADAAMGAKMGAQHDLVTHPVYKMDSSGNIDRVSGDLSEQQYRKGNNFFTMTNDQQQKMSKLAKSKLGGLALFDAADKAYKAKTGLEQTAEVAADLAMKTLPGAAIVANTHPDLYNYVSQRNSALGDYARSLGGEVGVLTDQDIARVIQMFPNASDTSKTRLAKRRAFEKLIKINEDALKLVLIGNKGTQFEGDISPEQLEGLKRDKALQSKINGILGSVEGLNKKSERPQTSTEEQKAAGAELQERQDKRTRAERLAEEMRKGK